MTAVCQSSRAITNGAALHEADAAFCDPAQAGGTCVARKPADSPCGGDDECAKDHFCKTSTQTCSPRLPEKAVCATGAECLSALCDNSACGEGPGSELAFICGGT